MKLPVEVAADVVVAAAVAAGLDFFFFFFFFFFSALARAPSAVVRKARMCSSWGVSRLQGKPVGVDVVGSSSSPELSCSWGGSFSSALVAMVWTRSKTAQSILQVEWWVFRRHTMQV